MLRSLGTEDTSLSQVRYQREVDKGKLTAVACFEKLTSLLRRRAHSRNVSFSKLTMTVNLPLSASR